MYQVSLQELTQAAALIRSQPELTAEQLYGLMAQANPKGLTQEQIQEVVEQVTLPLVELEYTEDATFESYAPWLRALPEKQVGLMLKAIHQKYLENIKPLLKQETIDMALELYEKALSQRNKFSSMLSEDPEIQEGYTIARQSFDATAMQMHRRLVKLGAEGFTQLPNELVEE